MLNKIGLKQAGLIFILVSIITIGVHLLVIFNVMPYTWINGGRSESFEIARQTSLRSILIFVFGIPITLLACDIIRIRWTKISIVVISIWLWINFALTCFGFVEQLLGTPFEKSVMSVVCAVGAIVGIRLALEKRRAGKVEGVTARSSLVN